MARKKTPVARVQIPLKWVIPEDVVARVATNMVAQHSNHEFIISFFEAYPPILLGGPEGAAKTLEATKYVEARCVARVVVAPERMAEFLKVLSENLANFHKARAMTPRRQPNEK
jgi:hypothetical protein